VRIDISVPGKDVVVDRAKPANHAHEDVYVAVRDAFEAAVRRLEDHSRKMRGEVKTRATPPHGTVARMLDDYGFIATTDGQEIYFHRNSVVGDAFDALEVGSEVALAIDEKEGVEGPQASTVRPVGKHRIAE